jgi:hypothetical protein
MRKTVANLYVTAVTMIVAALQASEPASGQTTTEEFMNRLVVCAGGVTLDINAKLLGSVRSIYEGDRTQGTAYMKTEGAFLDKLGQIPEKDRLAALELYHKCVREIMQTSYAINQETLNFKFGTRIPTDLYIDLNNANEQPASLLRPNDFFPKLFDVTVSYKFMRSACAWKNVSSFNSDQTFYFSHAHMGEMFPDNISVSKVIWGQHFAGGTFFFGGKDWSGDKLTSKHVPDPSNPLRSVESLVGKCMYVQIYTILGLTSISDQKVRHRIEQYAEETFGRMQLNQFTIKLNDNFEAAVKDTNTTKVFQEKTNAIWQVKLPTDLNGFRIR